MFNYKEKKSASRHAGNLVRKERRESQSRLTVRIPSSSFIKLTRFSPFIL